MERGVEVVDVNEGVGRCNSLVVFASTAHHDRNHVRPEERWDLVRLGPL